MLKVYIEPNYKKPDKADGGIRRVVEAQFKYLPDFDVTPTREAAKADVLVGHGTIFFDQSERPFVSSNHGAYWADYKWQMGEEMANAGVVNALIRAQAVTVPSYWVRQALTRGMLIEPTVIYHGVDADDWKPDEAVGSYVLWNKARADAVSDPNDMQRLAARMSTTQFISTLGIPTVNVRICGVMPLPKMKAYIQQAGVYLATARETFGIGTLEAMAAGVPVAGWRYGGQAEIIKEGETGYLAEYGNYNELGDAVRKCLAERKRLSENARADVRARWAWPDKVAQYAALYKQVYQEWNAPRPKVSVIVTCYNLAKYLPDALKSVATQTFTDWECVIVDDASNDETPAVSQNWTAQDKRFSYHRSDKNLKLSGARNFGFAKARGCYVINLDADDMLEPKALATMVSALDKDAALHIAYGRLDVVATDGSGRRRNEFPSGNFDWTRQMSHLNQLHYSALMRREVWQRSGGYRERMWRAEDAEFWCRVTSFGFRAALVTDDTTLIYRLRSDSKGQVEGRTYPDKDGYWNEGFPWHQGVSGQHGYALLQRSTPLPHPEMIPFSAPGEHHPAHYQEPLVSVIIPVGPGHARLALDALDSLVAQNFGGWEAIVVNDTGEPWDKIDGAPYARVIKTTGKKGAGYARNHGIGIARGQFVLWLDADDWLAPNALRHLLYAYASGEAAYVYSDWVRLAADNSLRQDNAREYDQSAWLKTGQHAVTVLMATHDAKRIGGFDEGMPGWEDWDFFVKCAVHGLCGRRVPEPLLTYRLTTGSRRDIAMSRSEELHGVLRERYQDYTNGRKQMATCCGGHGAAIMALRRQRALTEQEKGGPAPVPDGLVRMKFKGPQRAPITYHVNGRSYSGANSDASRFINARAEDVARLEALGVWEKVRINLPPPPLPEPELPPLPVPLAAQSSAPEPATVAPLPTMTPAPAVIAVPAPAPTSPVYVPPVPLKPKRISKKAAKSG